MEERGKSGERKSESRTGVRLYSDILCVKVGILFLSKKELLIGVRIGIF